MTEDKRTAKKKAREQEVKKQKLILAVVGVCLIIAVGIYMISSCGKKEDSSMEVSHIQSENGKVEADKSEDFSETEAERLERVEAEAKAAGYPEDVIELLSKNPETVQFVENYGTEKGRAPEQEIEELEEGKIPQLLQWDARWGYAPYGTSIVAVCGCGPTCMSMVLSGLTGDKTLTPAKIAAYGTEKHYINEENDTYWIFMSEACKEWGINCKEKVLDEADLKKELEEGNPIICSVGPGDFTKNGHFIVFAGYDEGKIIVHDPFSQINSDKRWEYDAIKDQIKSMWTYSVE